MRRTVVFLMLLGVVAGCGRGSEPAAVGIETPSTSSPSENPLLTPGDFTLTDQDGATFHLSRLQGAPAFLFFGYTNCPDACPTMMSKLARAYRIVGPPAAKVPTMFVSVDPRDTPDVLKEYLSYYSVPSIGLTGTKEQIDDVVKRFGASYTITPSSSAGGPEVSHSTRLYVIDRDGNVVALLDYQSDPEAIAKALKNVL